MTHSDLEKEMIERGRDRFHGSLHRARQARAFTRTKPGRFLFRSAVTEVAKGLRSWLESAEGRAKVNGEAAEILSQISPEVAATIACKEAIDLLNETVRFQTLAGKIGSRLEQEMNLELLYENDRGLYEEMMRTVSIRSPSLISRRMRTIYRLYDHVPRVSWPTTSRYKVGAVLLDLIYLCTGLLDIVHTKRTKNKTEIQVTATKATVEWLERSVESHELRYPVFMPALIPPAPWTSPEKGGGYYSEELHFPLVVRKAFLEVPDQYGDMERHISCINTLQKTPWEINEDVMQVAKHFWDSNIPFPGGVHKDPEPIPPRPDLPPDHPAFKAWKKFAAHTHRMNERLRGRRIGIAKTFWLANRFLGKRFWFPYHVDFRGRVYPVPAFLQPQGDDLARGLLRFADPEPIDNEDQAAWLAIHGANLFGHDKVPFDERRRWVKENEAEIVKVYEDPLANLMWTEAEEPWQFLAFCLEWGAFLEEGHGFKTKIPVSVDGSTNGLQIFSLLLRDPDLAYFTNVAPTPFPQDVYSHVAQAATERLKAMDSPYARTFLERVGELPRPAAKRVVMTLPYGLTRYSALEYVAQWYREFCQERGEWIWEDYKSYRGIMVLTDAIWRSLSDSVGAAVVCMDWLKRCAKELGDNGVVWTTPVGMRVSQKYLNPQTQTIKTKIGGVVRTLSIVTSHRGTNTRKQANSIAPNFVHSLDASAMVMTVIQSAQRGVWSFQMIHDSFGTTAPSMHILAEELRKAYAQVFSRDLLTEFKEQNEKRTGVELPPCPQLGNFDPQEVLNSPYFFG